MGSRHRRTKNAGFSVIQPGEVTYQVHFSQRTSVALLNSRVIQKMNEVTPLSPRKGRRTVKNADEAAAEG